MKKLYRSGKDKRIAGVLGGFAEYVNIDATIIRLGYVLLTLVTWIPGILFYIICWIVIPISVSHETMETKKKNDEIKTETSTFTEKNSKQE